MIIVQQGDGRGGLAEFESGSPVNYPFDNFSFKVSLLISLNVHSCTSCHSKTVSIKIFYCAWNAQIEFEKDF